MKIQFRFYWRLLFFLPILLVSTAIGWLIWSSCRDFVVASSSAMSFSGLISVIGIRTGLLRPFLTWCVCFLGTCPGERPRFETLRKECDLKDHPSLHISRFIEEFEKAWKDTRNTVWAGVERVSVLLLIGFLAVFCCAIYFPAVFADIPLLDKWALGALIVTLVLVIHAHYQSRKHQAETSVWLAYIFTAILIGNLAAVGTLNGIWAKFVASVNGHTNRVPPLCHALAVLFVSVMMLAYDLVARYGLKKKAEEARQRLLQNCIAWHIPTTLILALPVILIRWFGRELTQDSIEAILATAVVVQAGTFAYLYMIVGTGFFGSSANPNSGGDFGNQEQTKIRIAAAK